MQNQSVYPLLQLEWKAQATVILIESILEQCFPIVVYSDSNSNSELNYSKLGFLNVSITDFVALIKTCMEGEFLTI